MATEHAGQMKIGIILPIAEDDETHATPSYADIRAVALRAESAGFDSVWVFDHLLFRSPDEPTAGSFITGQVLLVDGGMVPH